jgi:hypothetical protein
MEFKERFKSVKMKEKGRKNKDGVTYYGVLSKVWNAVSSHKEET